MKRLLDVQGCRMRITVSALVVLLFVTGCEDAPVVTEEPLAEPAVIEPQTPPKVARGQIQFVDGYRQGYEQATREGKPMLLFFTASWCEYCHQMANEAFVQEQVVRLSQRFVCILVDADREPDVCRQFQVRGYPTIQFLSPWGTPLNRVVGKKPGHLVVVEMHAALQALARREVRGATIGPQ
jgi:thiol:disulfide interchange protein